MSRNDEQPGVAQDLFQAARTAMGHAHAPYSHFPVGAALRGAGGGIFAGCNVENASYPEGWCAETSAIAALISAGETTITEILVMAQNKHKIVPCGGCRQRLAEFAGQDTPVHLCGQAGIAETVRLGDLLPRAFQLKDLT